MLLFDDSKKLEKALGEEAAAVIIHVFEQADEKWRSELATKADLVEVKSELRAEIAALRLELKDEISSVRSEISNSRAETMKWTAGMLVAQAALIATLVKLL